MRQRSGEGDSYEIDPASGRDQYHFREADL